MATFNLSSQVKIVNPVANIDSMYGPYGSTADACNQTTGVPTVLRSNGRTVGVNTVNGVVEYWWQNGITDTDLVIKSQKISSNKLLGRYSSGLGSPEEITIGTGLTFSSGTLNVTIQEFNPAEHDLDEFTNSNTDPFAKISDIPVLGYTPVNIAGDTMVGDLILNRDPEVALGAVTKQYVDNVTAGINFHAPVNAATTLNLDATYNNGVNGVGATLTARDFGALVVDTHTVTSLQRVLVWQQTDPTENGIYDLTVVGDGETYWQLTRSSDADNNPLGEMEYGDFMFVQQGDTYGGFGFICNTAGTIDIGTTPINYVQFNAAQAVTAGNGLQEVSTNILEIDTAIVQEKITFNTTGTGPATFENNVLNIPTPPVYGFQEVYNQGRTIIGDFNINFTGISEGGRFSNIWSPSQFNMYDNLLGYFTGYGASGLTWNDTINGKGISLIGQRTQTGYANFYFPDKVVGNYTLATLNDISNSGVGGNGTSNYIPKFTGTSTIGDSSIFDTGSTVSISGKLIVDANSVYTVKSGWDEYSTGFGYNALVNSTGARNTAFGYNAASGSTSGSYNSAFGQYALFSNGITTDNTAIGSGALAWVNTGTGRNTAIGRNAGAGAASSYNNIAESIFIGYLSRPGANSQTNQIVIGNDLAGAGSNTVTIGNNSITSTILKGLITAPLTTNSLIEADTTGKAVTTKEYVNNRLVVETTAGYTLTNADSGGIIIFKTTTSQTLTIPTGLTAGFECTFVTLAGVTLTVSATGITLNNNTSTVLLPQLSFTLKRMIATDTYIAIGNL